MGDVGRDGANTSIVVVVGKRRGETKSEVHCPAMRETHQGGSFRAQSLPLDHLAQLSCMGCLLGIQDERD